MPADPATGPDPADQGQADLALTRRVLDWHDPGQRRLPWRATRDPYAVLVSEVMAQQTQAERAGAAWTAFLARFPTPAALAAAPVADVIAAWQGLGYNRRAVNLHRCAQVLVAQHGGRLPGDLQALLALPGIGPYTARAVLAFAFGDAVLPVDTNVARVLSRVGGQPLPRAQAQARADDLAAAAGQGPALAAALMDLGAGTCTARRVHCQRCPLAGVCSWQGGPEPDPAVASAHRSRPQGRWAGSARQARGRLVDAMRAGPVPEADALVLAGDHGPPLLDALVADGLAVRTAAGFALPGWSGRGQG